MKLEGKFWGMTGMHECMEITNMGIKGSTPRAWSHGSTHAKRYVLIVQPV